MSVSDEKLAAAKNNSTKTFTDEDAWAIILAGGDGLPRKKLIPQKKRFGCPAQFCRASGRDYLVNETRKRIALGFAPEKTLFVVTENHARYYERALTDVPPENLIVQPQNDGSTFAVLYAALHLAKRAKTTTVAAFFPSDFRPTDTEVFMSSVKTAVEAVGAQPNLILLGVEPSDAGAAEEWIEPEAAHLNETFNVRRVSGFYDLVSPDKARELKNQGGLRHSSVMVGTIATFLRKIRRAAPEIYARFYRVKSKIGTPDETAAMRRVFYGNFADTDFSRDVLAKSADKLAVIPVAATK